MIRSIYRLFLLTLACASASPASAQSIVTADALRSDYQVLQAAIEGLHPGLYRYHEKAVIDGFFEELNQSLNRELPLQQVYLLYSRFLARIQCGHTYANFWNQTGAVQEELFNGVDKIPFTFRLVGKRMLVSKNASQDSRLEPGTEVLSINGERVEDILNRLMLYVSADGSNDAKRLHSLELTGMGEFETFDVFFPLLFPPQEGKFDIVARDLRVGADVTAEVQAISRTQRKDVIGERYGPQPETNDDLWHFSFLSNVTAYLKLGTYVTWKMEMDWRVFIADAFAQMRNQNATNLVLDLRGNEGGDDAVNATLLPYLLEEPTLVQPMRELLRYREVPSEIDPYLDTWDDSFRDRGRAVTETEDGFYTWSNSRRLQGRTVQPAENAFRGQIYLLVNAANSSATFTLASLMKKMERATLVGQTTGGNQQGITGGQMFFLRLPGSAIEVDLPVIGYYPNDEAVDGGLEPNVNVEPSIEDVLNGVDTELRAVLELIRN